MDRDANGRARALTDAQERHIHLPLDGVILGDVNTHRDPRLDAWMPLDESWPWESDLGDDPSQLPDGYADKAEAQSAHDGLAEAWASLSRAEKEAFLAWFREDGPSTWPWSRDEVADLAEVLTILGHKRRRHPGSFALMA